MQKNGCLGYIYLVHFLKKHKKNTTLTNANANTVSRAKAKSMGKCPFEVLQVFGDARRLGKCFFWFSVMGCFFFFVRFFCSGKCLVNFACNMYIYIA